MKHPISATIDDELIEWIDSTLKESSSYRNKSHLIELALLSYRDALSESALPRKKK